MNTTETTLQISAAAIDVLEGIDRKTARQIMDALFPQPDYATCEKETYLLAQATEERIVKKPECTGTLWLSIADGREVRLRFSAGISR